MHELSLLQNVREILEEHAISQHFRQVTHVTLEVGQLSCVEPDALRFGFDVVMKDSLAENAELNITELKGLGVCSRCLQQTELDTLYDVCASCGNPRLDIIQGTEMKIKDLLVI